MNRGRSGFRRDSDMRKYLLNLTSLLSVALAVALFAPQRAAAHDDDDPPSRVARLSYARGTVSFNPAGTDDWVSAVVNRPITTGDKLWTDNGSLAELHIGSAAIRLSGNTGFSFLNLDDRMAQLHVTEGSPNVRVRRLDEDDTFEIDTPNLAFSVLRPGDYKIDVNEAGDTTVVLVRDGQGEVTGGGSAYTIHPRETGTFAGTDQLDDDIQRVRDEGDDFDYWCAERDRRIDHSASARYVSDDVIGYEDLDEYGGWRPVPEYGTVWFPHTTVVGWAPYRYGHWVWISPWGWTWVDDEPWGFAPFHYGRWVVVGGVWGWVPCAPRAVVGVAYVRPVYAPALVAWVGGPHFSVGIGVGGGGGVGVAWFPLAPREVYVPSYRVSRTYVTNVNVSNTTVNNVVVNNYYNNVVVNKNVTNIRYVNQTAPNAVTVTSHEAFTSAQPVDRHMMKIDRREIESAQVNPTTPTVAPQQRSVLGAGVEARVRPPAAAMSRPVVARTAPPPTPVSFTKQQQVIQANGGMPPAVSQMRRAGVENDQQSRPNIRIAPPVQPGSPRGIQANRPADNPQLDQKHQQQLDQLRQKQDQERQKVEQKQVKEQQKIQQNNPEDARRQRVEQNQPQQRQQVEQPQVQERQRAAQENADQQRQQQRQQAEQQQIQERQKAAQQNAEQQRQQQRQQQIDQRQQQQLQQLEQRHDQQQQKLEQKQQQERQKQERPKDKPDNKASKDKPKDDKPHRG